jgi:hypothetical protein
MSATVRAAITAALQVRDMTIADLRAHLLMPRHKVCNCVTRMELRGLLCRVAEVRQLSANRPRRYKNTPVEDLVGYPALLFSLDMSRARPDLMRQGRPPIAIKPIKKVEQPQKLRQTRAPAGLVEKAIASRSELLPAWLGGRA